MRYIYVVTSSVGSASDPIMAFTNEVEANDFADEQETREPLMEYYVEHIQLDPDWC